MSVRIDSRIEFQGHLNSDMDEATRPAGTSTGPQPKKHSGGLGLRELITAAQTRRLRSKQLVSAAAKVYGETQPQGNTCELERVQDGKEA